MMKLYSGRGPNPFRVTGFLAEKGQEIETETLDLMGLEARQTPHTQRNSLGEVPVLVLDDGTILTESIAICRYLETLHPETPLFGATPLEIAQVEMWTRRIEQQIFEPMAEVARHTFELFADKYEQHPAYAESQRRQFAQKWAWLDRELSDGRPYLVGERFSVADLTGMAALMVCAFAEQPLAKNAPHANAWAERLQARPCWPL